MPRPAAATIPFFTALACLAPPAAAAPALPPEQIAIQGRLTNATGNPVPDGNVQMTFAVYDAATGGTPLWMETQSVAVSGGLYSAHLGAVSDFSGLTMDMTHGRWLGIAVGSDPEMSPRFRLAGAPYARRALSAETLGKFTADDFARLDSAQTFTGSNTFSGPVSVMSTATFGAASTLTLMGSMSVASTGTVSFAPGARLYLDAGTAESPGLAVQGDRNTGLFSPESDALSVATGGLERLRIDASGRVGIGLAADPAERLDVDGNVQATGEFQYASPRTFSVGVPGILFRPTESLFDTSYGSAGSLTVPVIHGSNMVSNYDAGILLPDGAVVTGLTIYVYDNDASCNLYALVKLKRRANTSTTAQDMSSCVLSTTGESTSIQSATTTTVDNATVDNAAYQYHLHAYFSATSSYFPTHFYGCRIEYTLKALRP